MQIEECHRGMKVLFGRANGAKTLGEIIKLNPTKAKVKTIEARGSGPAGVIWNVPVLHALRHGPNPGEEGEGSTRDPRRPPGNPE